MPHRIEVNAGGTIKLRITYKDESATLLDPDGQSVTGTIYDPNGAVSTTFAATRESLGKYFFLFTPAEGAIIGGWLVEFDAVIASKADERSGNFWVISPVVP